VNARQNIVIALSFVAVAGCDLSMTAPAYQTPPAAQNVAVVISPSEATVGVGQTVEFAAEVTGAVNTAVTWSVSGSSCGSVTAGGVYTAPGAATSCVVTAAAVAAPSVRGSAVVTVTGTPPPVAITISPATAAIAACRTVAFTATVTGSTNRAATWAVQEANGGTISASGTYTAPTDAGVYHVIGTAAADPTRTATATVTVTEQIISVTVSPATVTVAPGATAQLTANVTTSCGTFASVRQLNSDGTIQ
jgi:plastocyanin